MGENLHTCDPKASAAITALMGTDMKVVNVPPNIVPMAKLQKGITDDPFENNY